MSLFAISDLHLSTLDTTDKSMEVFGRRWDGYMTRLKRNWEHLVNDDDTVVIPGDISWALTLDEAVSDLKFIDELPGRKILGKGNHDFWWCTMKKHSELFLRHDIRSISFLFNNAHEAGDFIIAGTRGWYHDDDIKCPSGTPDFEKLTRREEERLKTSLKAARVLSENTGKEIRVFTHFPPLWSGKASEGIMELLTEFEIKHLYYGHIHGNYTVEPSFEYGGVTMEIISSDYLDFTPKIIK